jgi:hypothetical protein
MKRLIIVLLAVIPSVVLSQGNFGKYFKNGSLRFDFLLGGDSKTVVVYPEQIKAEPYWGGPRENLTDRIGFGTYRFRVTDQKSDSLIFSKGFCTLFQEWQTTPEAKKTTRTFYQSAIFPFPKRKVRFEIDAWQWDGGFKTIYTTEIDPENYFIKTETPENFKVVKILDNGKPNKKVDVVILAEGYRAKEMDKFEGDAKRLIGDLFNEPPFKEAKNDFNIYAVATPSEESGTDIPGERIYKNTRFNSTFYTFDIDRYLTTSDMKPIYDAASVVPWDQIYVLVNTERYGGGGFYNLVTVCSSDNELSKNVFIHEFGHGFAGLGDEYYTSSVSFEDFYNLKVEPWEPNLTTLVAFDKKWKTMVPDSVPIPTPRTVRYKKTVGVFEGGGYMSKGIYSPMEDCVMKSNVSKGFCPVCTEAIKQAIKFYTDN